MSIPAEWKDFISKPAVFYCENAERYDQGSKVFCSNCHGTMTRYFSIENADVCVDCFVILHEHAAIRRENKPTMPPIESYEHKQGQIHIKFKDGTSETKDKTFPIKQEMTRQELYEDYKWP